MEENVHTFGETAETVFIWVFGPLLKLFDALRGIYDRAYEIYHSMKPVY